MRRFARLLVVALLAAGLGALLTARHDRALAADRADRAVLALRAASLSGDPAAAAPADAAGRSAARWVFELVNTGAEPVRVQVLRLVAPAQRLAEHPLAVVVPAHSSVLVPLHLGVTCGDLPAGGGASASGLQTGAGSGGVDHGTVLHGSGDAVDVRVGVAGVTRSARLALESGRRVSVAGALTAACHPRLGPAALSAAWTPRPDGRVDVVVDTTSATTASVLDVRTSTGLSVTADVPLPVTVLTGRSFPLELTLVADCAALAPDGGGGTGSVDLVALAPDGGVAAVLPDSSSTGRATWLARQLALDCG